MTPKQERLAVEIPNAPSITEAARRAGYKHPDRQGSRMLKNVEVQQAVRAHLAPAREKARRGVADWVQEVESIAYETKVTSLNRNASGYGIKTKALSMHGAFLGIATSNAGHGFNVAELSLEELIARRDAIEAEARDLMVDLPESDGIPVDPQA